MTSELDAGVSFEVIVCGGHPEVRQAMAAALLARGLDARSCETAEVRSACGPRTAVLVVVLTRSTEELDLISWAAQLSVRVVAVHGPTDVKGREAARRAGADVLLPRGGRTAPLLDAIIASRSATPGGTAVAVGLPDQPQPEDTRTVPSPR